MSDSNISFSSTGSLARSHSDDLLREKIIVMVSDTVLGLESKKTVPPNSLFYLE